MTFEGAQLQGSAKIGERLAVSVFFFVYTQISIEPNNNEKLLL